MGLAAGKEASSVLLVGTLGASERGAGEAGPPTQRCVTSGAGGGDRESVQSPPFRPALGRGPSTAWDRRRLVSGLHSSVASGRPGPAGHPGAPLPEGLGLWGARARHLTFPGPSWERSGGGAHPHCQVLSATPRYPDETLGGGSWAEGSWKVAGGHGRGTGAPVEGREAVMKAEAGLGLGHRSFEHSGNVTFVFCFFFFFVQKSYTQNFTLPNPKKNNIYIIYIYISH